MGDYYGRLSGQSVQVIAERWQSIHVLLSADVQHKSVTVLTGYCEDLRQEAARLLEVSTCDYGPRGLNELIQEQLLSRGQ